MNKNRYVPSSDADKAIWLNNYTVKMSLYAALVGVSPAELTSIQKDNAMFQYIVNMTESFKQNLYNIQGYKNMLKYAVGQQHISTLPVIPVLPPAPAIVPEGIFDRVAKMVTRIKASLSYTDNIGSDLGIVASTTTVDVDAMQPELKIKIDVGKPHVKWVKGFSDALDLYADRNDGLGFVLIGRFTRNEYLDVTSLAVSKVYDEWHYKGIYVIADTPIGLYSKITSVDVKKL